MTYKTWVRIFIPKITKYKKIVRTHSKSKCVTNSQYLKKIYNYSTRGPNI